MNKTTDQHILEKSALIDAGVEFLNIAEHDLNSYGFGGLYELVGHAAMAMYFAIQAVEPGMLVLSLWPSIERYIKRNSK